MTTQKKSKVYAGMDFVSGIQVRCFLAVSTKKEIAKRMNSTPYHIRTYWEETGNKLELLLAYTYPDEIFYYPKIYEPPRPLPDDDYRKS